MCSTERYTFTCRRGRHRRKKKVVELPVPLSNGSVNSTPTLERSANLPDDEAEDIVIRHPRERMIASVLARYKKHPYVERAINNQRKSTNFAYRQNGILTAYLSEAGSYELLTREDEVELFDYINEGLQLCEGIDLAGETSPEEENVLLKLAAAHQVVFHTNMRLVVSIAKTYFGFKDSMPEMDIVQEGNVGLSAAIARFDNQRGLKFSTYATWWIRQGITRAVADKSRIIRIPVHMQETYIKVKSKVNAERLRLERNLTDAEIEAIADMPIAKYNAMMQAGNMFLPSLNAVADTDKGIDKELGDYLADDSEDTDKRIATFSDAEELKTIIEAANLRDKEKFIVGLRFGLDPEFIGDLTLDLKGRLISYEEVAKTMSKKKGMTLEEVGQALGVTRERIRQIEANSMRLLKLAQKRRSSHHAA